MSTGIYGSNYTQEQINSVPGLADYISNVVVSPSSNAQQGQAKLKQAGALIDQAMANPVDWVKNNIPTSIEQYSTGLTTALPNIQAQQQYLINNGVSSADIQNLVTKGQQQAATAQQSIESGSTGGFLQQILSNDKALLELAALAVIPGAAEALAPSIAATLSVSSATATAIASGTLSAATQVASGVPVDKALQNAAIGTIVSSGTNAAANAMISSDPNSNVAKVLTASIPGTPQGTLSPIVNAVSGALTSGVEAKIAGQNVADAMAKGGATSGLSSTFQQGFLASKTPEVNYDITTGQNLPKVGLDVLQDTTAFNADGTPNTNLFAPTGTDVGLKGQSSTDVFNPDGSANYDILKPGSAGGEGLTSTAKDTTNIPYNDPSVSGTEKLISDLVAQDIVRMSGIGKNKNGSSTSPSSSSTSAVGSPTTSASTSAVSNAALGSQQSPNAATGADIANIDPQGLGAKEGKIGGKYPWGEPEGTTKLKDEGQVV